jgi:hypothetical protein
MDSRVSWDLKVARVFKDPKATKEIREIRATKGL